jgi:hypothetical protein
MSLLLLFFFYMALPNGRRVGETRVDPADSLKYRWTGSAWIVDGSGTPSSSGFPTGRYIGDTREDRTTGRSYKWNGSAWVLLANTNYDTDQDGVFDIPAGSITDVELGASSVTETKLGAAAVSKSKLKYTVETVTITAATSGTTTVTAGAQILGYHVSAVTGAGIVKSMSISATTLTVNLSVSDTATVQVIVLEP